MKLLINEWKKKDGTTGYNVKVGLMNATGYGLCLGDVLKFKLCYTPQIKDVSWNGSTFKGVSVLAEILGEEPANITKAKHPEYGTYSLSLPSATANTLDGTGAGDCFSLSVEQFENKEGKKLLTYNFHKIADPESIEVKEEPEALPSDEDLLF